MTVSDPANPPKRPRRGRGGQSEDRRATVAEVQAAMHDALDEVGSDTLTDEGVTGPGFSFPSDGGTPVTGVAPPDIESIVPATVSNNGRRGAVYLPRTRSYELVQNGLNFAPNVTYEEWERDVRGLIIVKQKIDWALADALAFGQERYGEEASQVLDDTPFATQTLWNMAWLARAIPREIRNDNIPFFVQAEVAGLPVPDQKTILEQAADEGLTQKEVRERVRSRKQAIAREAAENLPVPEFVPPSLDMRAADATNLDHIRSGSIHLLLTSPPYGIEDPERGEGMRKYRSLDDWRDWRALMRLFFREATRILAPGGRLAINVPFDTWVGGQDGGQRSTLGTVLNEAQGCGLNYVTLINWDEGNISKSIARGSVDSPSAPRVINRHEAIVVFCKGEYNRLAQMKQNELTTDLTHDEWLSWTDGTWVIPGESNGWEGFSAAWPQEVARRLIKLFSFQQDIICDPFAGSFTSALVAWRHGRAGYFSDIEPEQVDSGRRRLAAAAGRR
jgi:DNA modification methylase